MRTETKIVLDADTLPDDFKEIDSNPEHWVAVELPGYGKWIVPNSDFSDMTDAMMGEIAGWDDTVEPLLLEDKRGTKFMLAYLMQDGDLDCLCRYGRKTSDVAQAVILHTILMSYHQGEPMSYYSLHSDMGIAVNDGDINVLVSESQYICDENKWGVNVKELLGDAYVPQTMVEKLVEFINESVAWVDADEKDDGSVEIFIHDEDGATNLWKLIKGEDDDA